jgi:hypothetical protein
MNPTHYFVPYIDIDELGTEDGFSELWGTRVKKCIDLVCTFLGQWHPNPRYQVFFNSRWSDKHPGLRKYSFHVHFCQSLVGNIDSFKAALRNLSGMPARRVWTKTGPTSYKITEDPRGFIFDSSVYGGAKQLFRGPFCGKAGNPSAKMVPVTIVEDGPSNFTIKSHDDDDERAAYIFLARISSTKCDTAGMVTCALPGDDEKHLPPVDDMTSQDPFTFAEGEEDKEPNEIVPPTSPTYDFLKPIIYNEVLPAWQAKRDQLAKKSSGGGFTVPLHNLSIGKDSPHHRQAHVRVLKVKGDTFCETDSNHYHSTNPYGVISLFIDLHKCLVWQYCYACGKAGEKFYFLHVGNRVDIKDAPNAKLTKECYYQKIDAPYGFLLSYYADLFCLHPPTETLYVLDSENMVWRTGSSANAVIGKLFDSVNGKYSSYIQERQTFIMESEMKVLESRRDVTPQEKLIAQKRLVEDGRKFINKHKSLMTISVSARAKFVEDLRNFPVRMRVPEMNAKAHLIPMRNLQAYDVFTGETHGFQSRNLFTGILDAELTVDSADLKSVDEWFLEIATGNREKATYLQIISGYMMTFLMHDRKFYVMKGTGKNGKGIHKQFLVSILSGCRNAEPRWKALNQNFWERKANSNSSAEAPSPEAHGMLNKTLFYTDDIERVTIDAGKVKRVVAGEVMSGRGLYSKPVVIEPKGKILWTTNHTIDLPGNDNAAWERFNQIDYNTKYVEKPEMVDVANFKILQNDVAVQELLMKTDAFFTLSVRALTTYYRSLRFNPQTGQPLTLTHFPVPDCVNAAKAEARSQQLPLANFIRTHTTPTDHPLYFCEITELFLAYISFLDVENERRVRNETTQTSFVRQLATSLEIKCSDSHVIGVRLTSHPAKRARTDEYVPQERISADASV